MVATRETTETQELIAPPLVGPLDEAAELLNEIRAVLKRRLSFFVWQGFFEPLSAVSLSSKELVLEAPTSFHRNWVLDHYMVELNSALLEAHGYAIKVTINSCADGPKKLERKVIKEPVVVKTEKPMPVGKEAVSSPQIPKAHVIALATPPILADDIGAVISHADVPSCPYTFENFIQGPSNQMCYSAALSVANDPGKTWSPLFIFGGVGLGKTHLLYAIRQHAKQKNPTLRIVYISAESWVNAYVQAVRERSFDSFRNYYRNCCDILLIDDIQFLAGKDASQDEFFHTFNCLHETKKQIVVTSDKYPHEIGGLEERLQTRLAWGLIADIRPPELETRLTILQRKSELLGLKLSSEVTHFIASNITNSVRELEGALVRLAACSTLAKNTMDVAYAKELLAPVIKKKTAEVSWKKICDTVASYYDLKSEEILGQSRQRQVAFARQMAMACCRTLLSMSTPEIGKVFGRDHSTVISALRKIEGQKRKDVSLATVISKLEDKIVSLRQN